MPLIRIFKNSHKKGGPQINDGGMDWPHFPYAVAGIDAEYLDNPQRIHCQRFLGIWDIVALDFKTTAISDAASKLSAYMKNM